MISKVYLDGVDTYDGYGLLLASKTISAPEVRTNYIDVPGMDGLLDASEALTGEPAYKNRTITLTLLNISALSGKEWPASASDFLNAVHGKRVKISFSEGDEYYYLGRCSLSSSPITAAKQAITATIDCDPWKYKVNETTVSRTDLSTSYKTLPLTNDRRTVIPSITVAQETTLLWNGNTTVISSGTHRLASIRLAAGSNTLKAKVASGTGTITVTYQEASL